MPETEIQMAVLKIVAEFGATELADMSAVVLRRLGFKRLGTRIKARLERSIATLVRQQRLNRQSDGRLALVPVESSKST